MLKLQYFFIILVSWIVIAMNFANSLPTPEEDRFVEKELNRELINWLQTLQTNRPLMASPYKLLYGLNSNMIGANQQLSKRNSELINSLLGLPKNLNDAGK